MVDAYKDENLRITERDRIDRVREGSEVKERRERALWRMRSTVEHRGERPRKREVCVNEWDKTAQK